MVQQMHYKTDVVFDQTLTLDMPLYELDGGTLKSRDAYGHVGAVNGALWRPEGRYFDGVDDRIVLPDVPPLMPVSQISLEAWFKPLRTITSRVISRFPADYKGWSMYHTTSVFFQLYTGASLGEAYSAAGSITQDTWHHAVGTYDGAYMRVYINGNPNGTPLAKTGSIVYSARQPVIGMDNTFSQPFQGIIGEVRIYGRALTALEVLNNYLGTKRRYV